MSLRAMTLVWERSRAKGSNLLVLLAIADCAHDDGRDAWPTTGTLALKGRLTDRAVRLVLHKLEFEGEITIEVNSTGRVIELRAGRRIEPQWFLHIRCVCDWAVYAAEKPEKFSGVIEQPFRGGRPRKLRGQQEKFSCFRARHQTRQPENFSPKPEIQRRKTGKIVHALKERTVSDPSVEAVQGDEQGLRPDPPREETAKDHVAVLTRIAHEQIQILGTEALDLTEAVKAQCASLRIATGPPYDLVRKAIESAIWQVRHRGEREVS